MKKYIYYYWEQVLFKCYMTIVFLKNGILIIQMYLKTLKKYGWVIQSCSSQNLCCTNARLQNELIKDASLKAHIHPKCIALSARQIRISCDTKLSKLLRSVIIIFFHYNWILHIYFYLPL